jgi:hypothetical protein
MSCLRISIFFRAEFLFLSYVKSSVVDNSIAMEPTAREELDLRDAPD